MHTSTLPVLRRTAHRRAATVRAGMGVVMSACLVACGTDDDGTGADATSDRPAATAATVPTVTSDPSSAPPSLVAPSSSPAAPSSAPSLVPAASQPVPDGGALPPPAPGPPSANAEAAIADLAAQQGVDPATITVVGEENVTWPDSSIGCPEEGMAYMQVLTDGVRLVLELDGVRYEYHAGGSRSTPFLCPDPTPPTG